MIKSWCWLKRLSCHRRRFLIVGLIIGGLWTFGLGALTSYFLARGRLDKFPDLTAADKVLILAPHVDDEVISSGGLIQAAQGAQAKVLIVYLTNGDNNPVAVISENKNLRLDPNEFVRLGMVRMEEAKNATRVLGLNADQLIFLGYPDQGLLTMLDKAYDLNHPVASRGTDFTYNPYSGTYRQEQVYSGANVVSDLIAILNQFQPTMVIVSHPRDRHPDHRATYQFLEKALADNQLSPAVFAYLVHYSYYPPGAKKLNTNQFLYPPKKLYSQEGWYSYNLTAGQIDLKLKAVQQNASQQEFGRAYNLLQSLVTKNEIFEKLN